MKQQGEILDNAYKDNIVMGMKLAEHGAGAECVKPLERVLKEMDRQFIQRPRRCTPRCRTTT